MTTPASHGRTTQPKVDWTIMLYIAADDVLANFAVESLRQLCESARASAPSQANVVVAAQFAFSTDTAKPGSANGEKSGEDIEGLYIFKKDKVKKDKVGPLPRLAQLVRKPKTTNTAKANKTQGKVNMSQKDALTAFMKSVYTEPECEARRYALILWGHGPELLLQPSAGRLTGGDDSMYITPEELRGALHDLGRNRPNLDIIGFDACFMSMFEMAYELQGLAEYMVASQDEVPDASFPYDKLIELFRKDGKMRTTSLLDKGVKAYVSNYQDCICDQSTGMKRVTLSLLNLKNCDALQEAIRSLACALLNAKDKAGLAKLLIEARGASQDYASGLYVDLHDFCEKLETLLKKDASETTDIKYACRKLLKTLAVGTSNFILDNSDNKCSHGVSIYFPYLKYQQYVEVSKPLVKGGIGTRGAKGFSDALNGAAAEYLMCARRSLILDTEGYYGRLKMARDTSWYSFITKVWTRALIETAPAELDFHYSAQQAWMNVTRPPGDPDGPGRSDSAEATSNEEAEGVLKK